MHTVHLPSQIATEHSCITIGNFDGVHRGHQSLIMRLLDHARDEKLTSIVVTFWPHPRSVVSPQKCHCPLQTREQRLELLSQMGVAYTLELAFTKELASLSPEEFVSRFLLPLKPKMLITGYDFSLGRGRSGHTEELRVLGARMGFGVEQLGPVVRAGEIVSSTRLRAMIAKGDVEGAAHLLGRPYTIVGQVVEGRKQGTILGYPTANLEPPQTLLPAEGVYAATVLFEGRSASAVVNIGCNPTFGNLPLTIESFLLDTNENLYGRQIRIAFLTRLREERRFGSVQDLQAQIGQDVDMARQIFAAREDGK